MEETTELDVIEAPSRERFRQQRRAIRSADRRRKLIGLPIVTAGVCMVAAGVFVFLEGRQPVSGGPAEVSGISVERQSTTSTTSTTIVMSLVAPGTDLGE